MTEKIEHSTKTPLIKKRSKSGGKRPGSGRKRGTPNKLTFALKTEAAKYGGEILDALVALVRNGETPPNVIVAACRELLDRGFGRPTISIEASMEVSRIDVQALEELFNKNMKIARERQEAVLLERAEFLL